MPRLPDPSDEQAAILSAVEGGPPGLLVSVNAVAGAGKTTLVALLASRDPGKRTLLCTYNSELKAETRDKGASLPNFEAHSYHSLAVKYYRSDAYRDEALCRVVEDDSPPRCPIPRYDYVAVDEAQDMRPAFFGLVTKLLRDSGSRAGAKVLVMGDRRQCVYGYMGADERFLTLAGSAFRPSGGFLSLSLPTSYRLGPRACSFVNLELLKADAMVSSRARGAPVTYLYGSARSNVRALAGRFADLLSGGYSPEDFFVLVPSVKGRRAPFKALENALCDAGVPCYVPLTDDKTSDTGVMRGKVVFTTFHQSKGRERKVVAVFGFDEGFYEVHKGGSRLECPNPLYVACTRSSELLFLVHDSSRGKLPFLAMDLSAPPDCVRVEFTGGGAETGPGRGPGDPERERPPRVRSFDQAVTDVTKFLKTDTLVRIDRLLSGAFRVSRPAGEGVAVPQTLRTGRFTKEDVSELNGLAVVSLWEHRRKGSSAVTCWPGASSPGDDMSLVSSHLKAANLYCAASGGLRHKVAQIGEYTWLDGSDVGAMLDRLDSAIGPEGDTERPVSMSRSTPYGKVRLRGRVDFVAPGRIFEIKSTESITLEHKMQTALYALMRGPPFSASLVNCRTGEELELAHPAAGAVLESLFSEIVADKMGGGEAESDEGFIRSCRRWASEGEGLGVECLFV